MGNQIGLVMYHIRNLHPQNKLRQIDQEKREFKKLISSIVDNMMKVIGNHFIK